MALQNLSSYVQRKGQVTILQELQELFNIRPGDQIYFKQSTEGILITTERFERLAQFEETLAELSEIPTSPVGRILYGVCFAIV